MDWTKVVTDPLGLAGFALSLAFGVLSTRPGTPPWWPKAAAGLALVCIVGGLCLAYQKVGKSNPPAVATAGDCSPTFSGVQVGGNLENKFNCKKTPASETEKK